MNMFSTDKAKPFDGFPIIAAKAVGMSIRAGMPCNEVLKTKFMTAYFYGYPSTVMKSNPWIGERALQALLIGTYGSDLANVIFSQIAEAIEQDCDPQIITGSNFGARDGAEYWQDFEETGISEICTRNLQYAFENDIVRHELLFD